ACQVPSASSPCSTGTCSEVAVSMVLICAGMSSGPSVSRVHPAFSGASRVRAVIKSSSTDGSAFSWIVSDAEVWRMNSVTAPSRAPASLTNFAISAVRSTKPRPEVRTVRIDDTMLLALTVDDGERESDFDEVIKYLSTSRPGGTPGPTTPGDHLSRVSLPQYLNAKTRPMGPSLRRDASRKGVERCRPQILPVATFCI